VLEKCNDTVVKAGNGASAPGGNAGACDPALKIAAAATKLRAKINGKCQDAGVSPAAVDWPGTCPDFEQTGCTNPIATSDDIASCLLCVADTAVSQAIDLYYLDLTNAGTDAGLIKCQRTIGKETTKFLRAKDKALRKCRKLVDKGDLAGPCPDGPVTNLDGSFAKTGQGAIAKAESKKVGKIYKACDTASVDGMTCTGPDRFTPAQIGFANDCPALTVPGGRACAGAITNLNDLVTCVDCVSEFKVDCVDRLAAPHQASYPGECVGPTPTATPTPTPTPTLTPSPTPMLPPCGNNLFPACNGTCPVGQQCCSDGQFAARRCADPAHPPCNSITNNQCQIGTCPPGLGMICGGVAVGICGCG